MKGRSQRRRALEAWVGLRGPQRSQSGAHPGRSRGQKGSRERRAGEVTPSARWCCRRRPHGDRAIAPGTRGPAMEMVTAVAGVGPPEVQARRLKVRRCGAPSGRGAGSVNDGMGDEEESPRHGGGAWPARGRAGAGGRYSPGGQERRHVGSGGSSPSGSRRRGATGGEARTGSAEGTAKSCRRKVGRAGHTPELCGCAAERASGSGSGSAAWRGGHP